MTSSQATLDELQAALHVASKIRGQELKLPRPSMADQRLVGGESVTDPIPIRWPMGPGIKPAFLVQITLRDNGRRFDCVGLDITPLQKARPLNATLIHQIPIRELIKEAISFVMARRIAIGASLVLKGPDFWDRYVQEQRDRLTEATRGEGTGRRYPAGHLAQVADIYREATRAGKPTAASVAEIFGTSPSAAANMISRARSRGLLDDNEEEQQ
jgi:hypothetical protein